MTEKLPAGEAYRQAFKDQVVKRSTSKRLAALQKEWIGDSEMTREQLIQRQRDLREDFYQRHPEHRAAA